MRYSEKLYAEANQHFHEHDYDVALENITECITSLRKTAILMRNRDGDDFKRFIDAKMLQGRIYMELGLQEEADEVLDSVKSMSIGTGSNSYFLMGKVNYFFFDIELSRQNYGVAFEYLKKAKDYFIKAEDFQNAIDILFDMERYPTFTNDHDNLIEQYKEILEINQKLDNKNLKRINSGKTRLQMAKVLRRSDTKKSRKSLIMANNELMESPELYLDSMFALGHLYLRESPDKTTDIVKKIKENSATKVHELRRQLLEFSVALIMENDKPEGTNDKMRSNLADIPPNIDVADEVLEILRYIVIYDQDKDDQLISALLDYCKNVYDVYDDKSGKTTAYLLEGLLDDERENKMKLVEVYAKSMKDDHIQHLRPVTLDLIRWVSGKITAEEVEDDVKHFYRKDPILQAETLKLMSIAIADKDQADTYLNTAMKLYSKSKLKDHSAIKTES